jgi:hypothetical protein
MAFLLSYYAVQSVSIAEYKGGELANIQKRVYHAHEATAVEAFAIALLCGDVRCDVRTPNLFYSCITDKITPDVLRSHRS